LDFDDAMDGIEKGPVMYKVLILPVAKQDIKEAADWYNSRQVGLGK
jgi:hypothetical protein